ncbi:MAG: BolA family protein [Alphaproteobacteria bacterium]
MKGPIEQAIEDKLTAAFAPSHLNIINESHLHSGHAGAKEGAAGESHFRVEIKAGQFADMNRVARQRAVMDLLADEMKPGGIHALSIKAEA